MKSNQKTILFITIFLLLLNSALSETDYEELIEDDPAASFEQNPQKTWEALSQNPQLLEDPEVLKQAFENDPQKSIELINNNLELLNNPEVLDQFDSSIQDDINLLNNNKKAKKQWLKKKYNIKMSSGNTKILSYDGDFIKTGGKRGLKFRASDVPKAKILKDGSLKTPVGIFSNVKELKSVVQEGHGGTYKIVMSGGFIKAKPNNFHQDIDLKDGAKMTKFISDEGEITPITFKSVKGTIKVRLKDPFDETKLFSVESVGFNRIESDGRKMIVKGDFSIDNLEFDRFNFKSPATIKNLKTGTIIDVKGKKSFKYITDRTDLKSKYCKKSSCILNEFTSDSNPKRQGKIAVHNLNGQNVLIRSKAYQDSVESNNIRKGQFRFQSVDNNKKIISEIKVGPNGKIKIKNSRSTILKNTNVGRFDVHYKNSKGKEMQKHWSSKNNFQSKNRKFFRTKNKFVTCQVGFDCEIQFAKNFGKVKLVRGKYKHAIFVGGDHPSTAISALKSKRCRREGCIVLNTRDLPQTSKAQNMYITGHHYATDDFVWRDCQTASNGDHCGIDRVSLTDDFPKSKTVKRIHFTACNSLNGFKEENSVDGFIAIMAKKYPGASFVGVEGTELYHREFEDLAGEVRYKDWKSGKSKREGKRTTLTYNQRKKTYVFSDGDETFNVNIDKMLEEDEEDIVDGIEEIEEDGQVAQADTQEDNIDVEDDETAATQVSTNLRSRKVRGSDLFGSSSSCPTCRYWRSEDGSYHKSTSSGREITLSRSQERQIEEAIS